MRLRAVNILFSGMRNFGEGCGWLAGRLKRDRILGGVLSHVSIKSRIPSYCHAVLLIHETN
jgi:hypothetical protein